MDKVDTLIEMKRLTFENAMLVELLKDCKKQKKALDAEYDRWIDGMCGRSVARDEILRTRLTMSMAGGSLKAADRSLKDGPLQKQEYAASVLNAQIAKGYGALQRDMEICLQKEKQISKRYARLTDELYGVPPRMIHIPSFIWRHPSLLFLFAVFL